MNAMASPSADSPRPMTRERYVSRKSGRIIGMHTFGASAPLKALQQKFGFEPDRVTEVAKELLGRSKTA